MAVDVPFSYLKKNSQRLKKLQKAGHVSEEAFNQYVEKEIKHCYPDEHHITPPSARKSAEVGKSKKKRKSPEVRRPKKKRNSPSTPNARMPTKKRKQQHASQPKQSSLPPNEESKTLLEALRNTQCNLDDANAVLRAKNALLKSTLFEIQGIIERHNQKMSSIDAAHKQRKRRRV